MMDSPFPGLVDSHCHLDFPEFEGKLSEVREEMRANGVTHALCISVELARFPKVLGLAEAHDNFFASVGVHRTTRPGLWMRNAWSSSQGTRAWSL